MKYITIAAMALLTSCATIDGLSVSYDAASQRTELGVKLKPKAPSGKEPIALP